MVIPGKDEIVSVQFERGTLLEARKLLGTMSLQLASVLGDSTIVNTFVRSGERGADPSKSFVKRNNPQLPHESLNARFEGHTAMAVVDQPNFDSTSSMG